MTNGDDAIKRPFGANDHGTVPAAHVSPAPSAKTKEEPNGRVLHREQVQRISVDDAGPARPSSAGAEEADGISEDNEVAGIEDEFRRKLAGLRRLSRAQRTLALRAARDARTVALRLLQQRRGKRRDEKRIVVPLNTPRLG